MALSEYERRALADIEQALLHENPQWGARFANDRPRRRRERTRIPTVAYLSYAILGLALMAIGLLGAPQTACLVVLAGYTLLVLALAAAFYGWFQHRHD